MGGVAMAAKAGPTLEEVQRDIPPEKLDQPCQDKQLGEVARHVTDWLTLAPFLEITQAEEKEILGNWPRNTGKQKIDLLRKWKEKHGRKATYRRLCKAFWKAGEVSLVDSVCHVLRNQATSSESSSDENEEQVVKDTGSHSKPRHCNPSSCPRQVSSPSVPAAPGDPLEDLARLLRMSYGSQTPSFVVLQWPPPPTLKVFNLAMIHSQEVVQRTPLDEEVVQLTLRGGVDDIMKVKSSIKLEDLFKCSHKSKDRLVVLIEGAPGSGKSTLAWDICQKWKALELFHENFKIVIYVQFRDVDVQQATEIADLLPLMKSEQKDAASVIVSCRGEGVLFVLDGWDEYSPGLQKNSLFEKLICLPQKLGVQLSTVLITSRPIASGKLQPYATSRVEIVGFMPDEVRWYFKDVFKDPVMVQKLYDHLKERPTIKASCYLPLNAAIVAHLFIELNYTLPTTLHDLFCALVLSCIIRHMTKESGAQPAITSLDTLSPDVQEVFENICILAYKGTMSNKVIFFSQDLQSYGLPDNLSTLSLMQVVQSFATGKPSSYHFLHLSVQELLTALHISKLPSPEQVRIFTELFDKPRFDAVFRFYAGFTKLQTEGIRSIISQMISMSTRLETQRRRLLNLIHCLYEAQDTSLCYFVSSQLKGELDFSNMTFSSLDLLPLKYLLSCVNSSTTQDSDSDSCEVSVSDISLQLCELTLEATDFLSLCNLVSLNLHRNRVSCTCAVSILTNNPQLKYLDLSLCGLTDDGAELFAAALREHQSLKDLNLSSCTNSSRVTHYVLQAVLNHHSLQDLNVGGCPVDAKDVAAVLELNELLRVLTISGDEILDSDSAILSCSLRKNRTLEMLHVVVDPHTQPGLVEDFLWSLRDCHLRMLRFSGYHAYARMNVSSQLMGEVNAVRHDRGLPLLKVLCPSTIAHASLFH